MTSLQAIIIIVLLAVNAGVLGLGLWLLHDALHTLILQGNQRRAWHRPGEQP